MARGQVTIRTKKPGPNLAITAWLGEDSPTPNGGYGGWEIVNRPREVAITQWRGREPIQMDLSIVIDSYDGEAGSQRLDESVELVVTRLERMALPWKKEPPLVELEGASANLVPHDDLDWVITDIAWGTALRNREGNRVRQEATVSLLSHISLDKIKLRAAQRSRKKQGRK